MSVECAPARWACSDAPKSGKRAPTRDLTELGGLAQKAGLVELVDDDRPPCSALYSNSPVGCGKAGRRKGMTPKGEDVAIS